MVQCKVTYLLNLGSDLHECRFKSKLRVSFFENHCILDLLKVWQLFTEENKTVNNKPKSVPEPFLSFILLQKL